MGYLSSSETPVIFFVTSKLPWTESPRDLHGSSVGLPSAHGASMGISCGSRGRSMGVAWDFKAPMQFCLVRPKWRLGVPWDFQAPWGFTRRAPISYGVPVDIRGTPSHGDFRGTPRGSLLRLPWDSRRSSLRGCPVGLLWFFHIIKVLPRMSHGASMELQCFRDRGGSASFQWISCGSSGGVPWEFHWTSELPCAEARRMSHGLTVGLSSAYGASPVEGPWGLS